jgi:hypothetical protein
MMETEEVSLLTTHHPPDQKPTQDISISVS